MSISFESAVETLKTMFPDWLVAIYIYFTYPISYDLLR